MILFITYQIIIFLLIVLSAFFSGSETAIISANRYAIEDSVKRKFGAKQALYILNNSDRAVSMILIGNNIANIVATAFITYIANVYYNADNNLLFVIMVVQTLVFLLFCEILPKIFSRINADFLLRMLAFPLYALMILFSPVLSVTIAITDACKKFFRIDETINSRLRARKEIETLFQMGERAGLLEQNHRIYVDEILSMHKIRVNQVMTPTIEIAAVELKSSIKTIIKIIEKTRYSRIPVYEDRVDNIVGYIFYKDLYAPEIVEKKISDIMRLPVYVPETKRIYELYSEMKRDSVHLVFIVNEYGAVSGMATREDIAEEIVGEIQTTDHITDELVIIKDKNTFSVKGTLDIEYFCRLFSLTISKDGFETVGGFAANYFGRIPKPGEKFVWKNYTFEIETASDKYIDRILVTRKKRN